MKMINTLFILEILIINFQLIIPESSSTKEKPLVISFSFETKYIHEIPNDSNEDYYNDYGYDYLDLDFSPQNMINEWFYNGIYFSLEIGDKNKDLYLFLDVENSDFIIGPCNKINTSTFTRSIKDYSYYFSNSSTFSMKQERNSFNNIIYNIGKDEFTNKNQNITNLELKFILNNNNNNINEPICGSIGLNVLDKVTDAFETNILRQLKNNNLISNYIWTLYYRTEQIGNIMLGGEPHLFDRNNYYMSQYKTQYCQIKKSTNKEKISPWAFKFNNVYLNKTKRKDKIENITYLDNNEAELLIERGLIVGTQEYKNFIDEEFFNELFSNKTCRNDLVSFNNRVAGKESKYFVYSCEKLSFQGKDIYYRPEYDKPYFNFPSINFINKELNYTFSLINSNLFITKGRVYFLVIFDYESYNKIWKLGEPFLSKYKFVFNPDQKLIGFYNPNLPKIDNDIYEKEQIDNDNDEIYEKEKIINRNYLWYTICSICIIILLSGIVIYLAKKLHKERKKRPNELDDNFDYTEADGNTEAIN